jgi:hypothetical protein
MHSCRGNFRSTFIASGGYEFVAEHGGMATRTLGNGHATRMSPDRGNCRGSGLNDVHRGVGGTVVTVSSPYAQLMAHNASLSILARPEFAGGPSACVAASSKLMVS